MSEEDEKKRHDVVLFLQEFKECIYGGPGLEIVNRQNNQEALIELGLTKRNREEEILSLSVINFSSGPNEDKDRPGNSVWIFGTKIDETEIYIKLKIYNVHGEDHAKCISFHKAISPLTYPFAE